MSLSLTRLPEALQSMQTYTPPVNMPVPLMATGAVIPPKAVIAQYEIADLKQGIADLNNALNKISVPARQQGQGSTYRFTAQVNRRTLFDELIDEAKLRQTTTGRNPFELG